MKRANDNTVQSSIKASVHSQRGFTLLELMVAMAIFAMLAVAGWQVFDGVTRARERAQVHADNLAVLQYAYLQIQQDMGQMVAYQASSTDNANISNDNTTVNNSNINNSENANDSSNSPTTPSNTIIPKPFMSLDSEHVSFVRHADPDPRYQTSASIQRIEYIFDDQRLIRRQYTDIQGEANSSVSLDSVLLDGISAGRWQAYLPELSAKFPSESTTTNNSTNSQNNVIAQNATASAKKPEVNLLPKGVSIDFTYQEIPITWQWALAPQALPASKKKSNATDNSDNRNNNNANNNTNNNTDNNQDTSNPVIDGSN